MEKLVYTLKYAHQIDKKNDAAKPPFWKEDQLDEVLSKTDLNRMSAEEHVMFEMSLVKEVMYQNKLAQVAKDAAKEATEKATMAEKKETVILAHKKGLDNALIADITGLPVEKVQEIITTYKSEMGITD